MSSDRTLAGRVVLITGASAGIGAALARRLHAEGAQLALASRRGADLGLDGVYAGSCDVRDKQQVDAFVAAAAERFGRLDVVVANAGVGSYGKFLDVPDRHIDEMIDTNVRGTVYLLRAALPHLLEHGEGDVITVASEAGRRGLPGEAVYSASKFAQVGLTRALDNELRELGIRCTNICPGGVYTDFAMDDGRGRTPDSPQVKAMMTADDIADLIVYCLSRPRHFRILETALRPMSEASWG
ncbi:SDR family oxidoreductase [Microbispora sp. CA-102843]|uniref:SDR family oxidoreductase n=1 Tax=Microbispora sp. CA-102843 TaxID=3239952 RepID=UPI003D8F953D